jgi:hypothetical protein
MKKIGIDRYEEYRYRNICRLSLALNDAAIGKFQKPGKWAIFDLGIVDANLNILNSRFWGVALFCNELLLP